MIKNRVEVSFMPKYAIPAVITCPCCGKTKVLSSYCRVVFCDYCNMALPFEGFRYREYNRFSSKYRYAQAEMDCPNCGSRHMILGPEGNLWCCHDCNYHLKESTRQNITFWFCDNCDTYLNVQSGFTEVTGHWKCQLCGFDNDVSDDNTF